MACALLDTQVMPAHVRKRLTELTPADPRARPHVRNAARGAARRASILGRWLHGLLVIDPENLQSSLLQILLRISGFVGSIVYFPSVYFSCKAGFWSIGVVDTAALLFNYALLWLPAAARLPYRFQAATVCLFFYAIGVMLLMAVGPVSQIYLFGFSVLAVLLLGRRAGIYSACLSTATLFIVGALGGAAPQMVLASAHSDLKTWSVITLNFALVDVLMTVGVGAVVSAVKSALAREIASRASLAAEHKLLRTLIDALPDTVFSQDRGGRFVNCNPAGVALFGLEREEQVAGKTIFDLLPRELAESHHADDLGVMADAPLVNREEKSFDERGQPMWHLTTKVPLHGANGEPVGLLGVSRNITGRKLAEAERDRLIAQLQLQIERMPLAYILCDENFRFTRWNPAAEKLFGFSEREVLGKHPNELFVPADKRAKFSRVLDKLKSGSMDTNGESISLNKAGAQLTCEWHNTPQFDDNGIFAGVLSLAQDVTARKKLELQLRQAQKMEAVGSLAGGVAHDFNNLLSVIISYADLAVHELKPGDPMRNDLLEIQRAGLRAAELTGQLLAFSRQQVLAPQVIDINQIVASTQRMLRRLLGEDIEVQVNRSADLGLVLADPGQVEQVLMNLAVNARDAMLSGGKLTIETANVELDAAYARAHVGGVSGAYVMLAISDTGVGMDAATCARVFEPFFTTKEKGKGTGLGLSTVFGIVNQSGGHIAVESERGRGSTFKVYLPRTERQPTSAQLPAPLTSLRGEETILLVEDEADVRGAASAILQRHGYQVLVAANGGEAFLASKDFGGQIHLLLTDVVMPRMNGQKLAQELSSERPDMKVLFASGYADQVIVHHGALDPGVAFLQKPFTRDGLLRKVREVLDH